MNSIFRKTLIASALTAMFSTVAIAADDYSKTIDGSEPNTQGEMQQNKSTNKQLTTPNHEDEFNQTIDADVPRAGNKADPDMQKSTDRPNAGEADFNETIDADAPGAGNKADPKMQKSTDKPNAGDQSNTESDRPLTKHQSNVTEEEEEEEELGNTQMDKSSDVEMKGQMDRNNDVQMDEQPHGATGAGTPANRGGLYDMSADDLNGMDVITSDGESVGDVQKIVISPNNQDIHAVVSVGGLLGIGAKTILIPLDSISLKDDVLHVRATQAELEAMTDYGSEDFVELEGDAAVSTALRPKN
jgi:sporulation protein YlmC with PRC-barrel domain